MWRDASSRKADLPIAAKHANGLVEAFEQASTEANDRVLEGQSLLPKWDR
jgi:hypothetical protein